MRIAAKRLRYTLEIARPVYPGRLDEAIEATKRVQSLLGDVHDCDVWAGHLDAFALEKRRRLIKLFGHAGRFARLLPGIDYLRQDRRDHRQAVFGQLVAYWAQLGQRRLWDSLRGAVLTHGQTADVTAGEPVVAEPAAAQPTSAAAGDATPDPVRVVVSEEASFDFGDPNRGRGLTERAESGRQPESRS